MSKQDIEYKKYVIEKTASNELFKDECDKEIIMAKEEWLAIEEQKEAEEEQAYQDYVRKVGNNNLKLPEGKTLITILSKEEWLAKGKPTGESKAERFQRLIEPRTTKALSAIEKLFALKGVNYESTIEERKQVIEALSEAVLNLENHYLGQKEIKGFKLQKIISGESAYQSIYPEGKE